MGGSAKRQVGRRIRRLRKAQHQSQQALATAIGVHVNTVARWEYDGIDPRHRALPLIAAALQCSLEKLTGEPDLRHDQIITAILDRYLASVRKYRLAPSAQRADDDGRGEGESCGDGVLEWRAAAFREGRLGPD